MQSRNTEGLLRRFSIMVIIMIIIFIMYQMTETEDGYVTSQPINIQHEMSKSIALARGEGKGEANATKREEDREAFDRLTPGSWIVDDFHNMTYCAIAKNSCTKFQMLFHALGTNGTRFQGEPMQIHLNIMQQFAKPKEFLAETLIKDPSSSWRTFVVIRDPAERMVSAFMDKCVRGDYFAHAHWCFGSQLNETEFSVFADRIIQEIENGQGNALDWHFRPQHMICGLDAIYPKYVDDIIVYHKSTVAEDTLKYLQRYDLEEFNEGYGEFGNETLFAGNTIHTQQREEDDCAFYSKYFDADLYKRVRTAFGGDYSRLQLEDPKWSECLK